MFMGNEMKNSKFQHPNSRKAPNTKDRSASGWILELGGWLFLEVGGWNLKFFDFLGRLASVLLPLNHD
jgi:hypothetical protein